MDEARANGIGILADLPGYAWILPDSEGCTMFQKAVWLEVANLPVRRYMGPKARNQYKRAGLPSP